MGATPALGSAQPVGWGSGWDASHPPGPQPRDLASSSAHLEGPASSGFNSTDLPAGEVLVPPPGLQVRLTRRAALTQL